jgi:hypothetical protein
MIHIVSNILGILFYIPALVLARKDYFNVPDSLSILDFLYVLEVIIFIHLLYIIFFVKPITIKAIGVLSCIAFLVTIFSTIGISIHSK